MKMWILSLTILISVFSSKLVAKEASTNNPIIIAVIDSGLDSSHSYFQNKLIEDPSLVPNESNQDSDGHGTHVAGIIAQSLDQDKINYKLAPIKNCSEKNFIRLRNFKKDDPTISKEESSLFMVKAIQSAIKSKAKIVNISQGIYYNSPEIKAAFKLANEAGLLVIAASGNMNTDLTIVKNYLAKQKKAGKDVDENIGHYPCQSGFENIVCVGNYEKTTQGRIVNSSYGTTVVHVWAMGTNIESACIGGKSNCVYSGSSMSSPRIAAQAAKIWALNPNMTNLQIKAKLLETLPEDSILKESGISGKYLD